VIRVAHVPDNGLHLRHLKPLPATSAPASGARLPRVLATGASGLIGAHLLRALVDARDEPRPFCRCPLPAHAVPIEEARADIRDAHALQREDVPPPHIAVPHALALASARGLDLLLSALRRESSLLSLGEVRLARLPGVNVVAIAGRNRALHATLSRRHRAARRVRGLGHTERMRELLCAAGLTPALARPSGPAARRDRSRGQGVPDTRPAPARTAARRERPAIAHVPSP
jgi:hypothetical protein